ncbi:TlpA disulfide reductase family protein [Pedobacter frigoris]|uniref:AhpC/TSA family protein n=1 Tax=Pedobacter frigoris TaxID=2571272 RepID=A0A4U1CAX2_9SPHI|nr:TlpA disulfide reductase family protein [Pedobacter frigoris]TKC03663.1 AhpC/TSA family protein [Pedobacter frigoris]
MKKIALFYSLIIMITYQAQSQTKGNYTLNVTVPKSADGRKVYLKSEETPGKALDSTTVKNGAFSFTGSVPYPQFFTLVFNKLEKQRFASTIPVFVENKKINVSAGLDSNATELEALYTGGFPYEKINVTGSPAHDLFMKYSAGYEPLKALNSKAFDAYIAYLNPGKDKEKGPISEGIKLVENIDVAKANLLTYVKSFIKNNNTSPVALYVAKKNIGSLSAKEIDEALASLSPALKSSVGGQSLLEKAAVIKKTAVGSKFVDFAFNDKDGKPVKLSDHVGKGKYTLLEFWASWCGPCRADIPHLKEAYALYHPAGFEVISISMDDDKDKWLKAINEENMTWLQVSDLKAFKGDFSKIYNFNGIPTCVLVGPDGEIITRNMRGLWMDKKLIDLYGNKFGAKF